MASSSQMSTEYLRWPARLWIALHPLLRPPKLLHQTPVFSLNAKTTQRLALSSKIAGIKSHGAHVIFSGSTCDEREAVVAEVIEKTGAILVPPYDHPDIILGQGTIGLELEPQIRELQRPPLDAVITPLGGGGLLSGVTIYFSPTSTRVFGANRLSKEQTMDGAGCRQVDAWNLSKL